MRAAVERDGHGIGTMGGVALLGVLLAAGSGAEIVAGRSSRIQDSYDSGIAGFALAYDRMGHSQAVGDFNGDGAEDLVIGENESLTAEREGALHVIYSDGRGLSAQLDVLIKDFDPATGESDRELGDGFGEALAVGDFNNDGFDDLAVGIPREDIDFYDDAGVVLVIYGSVGGLVLDDVPSPRRFQRGSDGVFLDPHDFDRFASTLAAGDFDGDGYDDLAIGTPWSDAFTNQVPQDSGSVQILHGSIFGITAFADQYFDQDQVDPVDGTNMPGACEFGDHFGSTLAVGDFDDDGFEDLAVGVPDESANGFAAAGAVHVLYGSATHGLRVTGSQFWYEGNVATGGDVAAGDGFGAALAAGDVTGEGVDDLVIGAPREDTSGFVDAGAVTLLWGQPGIGIDTPGSEVYDQAALGDGESPAEFEQFGFALAIGDFVRQFADGRLDLAIGTPHEEVFDPVTFLSLPFAGSVTIVPGGFGLAPGSARNWYLGAWGSAGADDLAPDSLYGYSLAAGDFDGDGIDDLSIGAIEVEGDFAEGVTHEAVGAVFVLYGALFADGFESGGISRWGEPLQ